MTRNLVETNHNTYVSRDTTTGEILIAIPVHESEEIVLYKLPEGSSVEEAKAIDGLSTLPEDAESVECYDFDAIEGYDYDEYDTTAASEFLQNVDKKCYEMIGLE